MKKAVFQRFIAVLLVALALCSVLFYFVLSSILLETTKENMLFTLKMLDGALGSEEDWQGAVNSVEGYAKEYNGRLTLINEGGGVIADTGVVDTDAMDNHLERREVQEAMADGTGYSIRFSDTLNTNMLYVALRCDNGMLLRMAVPYMGLNNYLPILLPSLLVSLAIALVISAFMAKQFAGSVTKPLMDISQEMGKMNGNYTDLSFEQYQYPELNIIAETTTNMSRHVKEYLEKLEQEKQIRQEFFSNASHELKTPITSISGYTELLESGMIVDPAMQKDFLMRIKKETANMTGLINDILMISRLEANETTASKSEVRMSLVLDDVLSSMKPLAAEAEVFIIPQCETFSIEADPQQMKELLGNLISNAIKYNRPGGKVWVTIEKIGDEMIIRVKDNGIGIPKEDLPRIFVRFYRVDKGRNKKMGGTGLGLSIVKHIVQFNGGTIEVFSQPNEGTEFVVNLPACYKKEETEDAAK